MQFEKDPYQGMPSGMLAQRRLKPVQPLGRGKPQRLKAARPWAFVGRSEGMP